jgi:hypothetical protein
LLHGSDAVLTAVVFPWPIALTARQDRNAPEDVPHTPPHAAQTASGGTNPPERSKARPWAPDGAPLFLRLC